MTKSLYRLLLSAAVLALPLSGYSQAVQGKIGWEGVRKTAAGNFPSFDQAVYTPEIANIAKYCAAAPVNAPGDLEATFTGITYEPASPAEKNALKNVDIGNVPRVELGYGSHKNYRQVTYCFYPYVKQNGEIKRIASYNITISPKSGAAKGKVFSSHFKNQSVLSQGNWYKFRIGEDGIYKLTPGALQNAGIDLDNTSIANIRVFGNGQGILPLANSASRKDDLHEIPVKMADNNNNGKFDGNDYLLFCARGPHTWRFDKSVAAYAHTINFYRDYNYYYVTTDNGVGKRIQLTAANPGTPNAVVTAFDDYAFKEDEKENLVGAGRVWVGDVFDFELEKNYSFVFPDIVLSEPVRVRVRAVARASTNNTYMQVSVNGAAIMNFNFDAYKNGTGTNYVELADQFATFNVNNAGFSVKLRYDNSANPTGVAWLDFIEVQGRRNLYYRGKALFFRDQRTVNAGNVTEFQISNANSNIEIWDITDINNTFAMPVQLTGNILSFSAATDSLREFAAVSGSDFPVPDFAGPVPNQNLHAMQPAEMYIVVHPAFLPAAEELADFHRNDRQMSIEVVTTEQIYNEFSSGGQDISAIRDFVKMVYDRNNGTDEFKYLLLFGDASYDYRDRLTNNSNYVPIWQSEVPFNLYYSTVSDDFYGNLDADEGVNLESGFLDIGIGRIPCATLTQARQYVDKVIHYVSGENRFGDWRNKILLMADDVDESWETTFVTTSEKLEQRAKRSSNAFNVEKIYLDAYKQVTNSGTEAYPEASKDMFRKIQQGNLVTNYIGHGGEIGLSSERFLQLADVNSWTNYDAMPLFMTITCEFTRLDDPKRVSAGEQLLLNPKGGAIALLSTTRVVDVQTATNLNANVFDSLLTRPDGLPKNLGEIIKDAKNGLALAGQPYNRLKFSLFGDPSIQLAIPHNEIQTNTINGKPVASGGLDTLKALSKVTITGQVNDLNGQKMETFSGILNVSVFDKPNDRVTLRNDGAGSVLNFTLQNNLIYRGKVEVSGGDFQIEFLVPRDIAYQYGFGKISYYSADESTDAAGFMDTLWVGGYNQNAPEDNIGPEVKLYINDESFVRGGITSPDPELFARISDSSGVNTVGNGIGHDLVAVLDKRTDQSYVINEYYEADLNSYKSGEVRYSFYDLEPGNHSLKLKVFDVYNNFSEAETDFIVADDEEVALKHVLNYPNPFTTYTEFHFEHNRANQPLDVQVQVFTVSGKLVKTINTSVVPSGNRVTGIAWNGLDDYGDKIGKGVYVYRLKVKSPLDNSQAEKYEKLVILR